MSGGTLMVWLRVCSASIGVPAAIRPINGTETGRSPYYAEAGALTEMHLPYLELVRLIQGAGKRPVERDSLYQTVREQFDDPPPEPSLGRGAGRPVVHAA